MTRYLPLVVSRFIGSQPECVGKHTPVAAYVGTGAGVGRRCRQGRGTRVRCYGAQSVRCACICTLHGEVDVRRHRLTACLCDGVAVYYTDDSAGLVVREGFRASNFYTGTVN